MRLFALGLVLLACLPAPAQAELAAPVIVASKTGTEGVLLGSLIALALEQEGIPVATRLQLGPTRAVRSAILSGEIHGHPEYIGNGAFFHDMPEQPAWRVQASAYDTVRRLDAERHGLVWPERAPANSTWLIALRGGRPITGAACAEAIEARRRPRRSSPEAKVPLAEVMGGLLRREGSGPNIRDMSVITRLRDFFHEAIATDDSPATEEHQTVGALLILVARADGTLLDVEAEGLRVLLGARFGLTREQAERLLDQVAEIEGTLDASTTLVDRILQDVSFEERPRLLALAYRIAAIDGRVHEFEDDLIWRTGRLLDLSDSELADIKADALKNLAPDRAGG